MSEVDLEENTLLALETVLLHLHDQASVLSDLIDTPIPTRATAAISAKVMRDAGEVSRQNMILLEDVIRGVRSLHELHRYQPRPPLRVAWPRKRYIATMIGVAIGGVVLGFLIPALFWVPVACVRGIWATMA